MSNIHFCLEMCNIVNTRFLRPYGVITERTTISPQKLYNGSSFYSKVLFLPIEKFLTSSPQNKLPFTEALNMGRNLEPGQPSFLDLKNYMEDDEASLLINKTDLLKAFFDFLDQERSKLKKEKPADLQSSLLILLLCIATLVTLFTVYFFWRSRYGDLTLVELCAQRKRRANNPVQEADPPPAYSRRASEAEPSPADNPPSYTRARGFKQPFGKRFMDQLQISANSMLRYM